MLEKRIGVGREATTGDMEGADEPAGMTTTNLMKRAVVLGASQAQLDAALANANPRASYIELITQLPSPAAGAEAEAARQARAAYVRLSDQAGAAAANHTEPEPEQQQRRQQDLEQLMREADSAQLEHLLAQKEEKGMSELIFAQALQLLPRRAAGGADDGQPSVEALMAEADPEQLKYLLLAKEAQGMSDLVFRQALQLLPTQGDAARKGGQASAASVGVGLDVEGEVESVPPGMTAAERTAWEDDGFFWRRGCFTADQMQAAKAEIRPACEAGAAPMGMVTGPGARVFFADDPTAPSSIPALATDPAAVLGPLREIVGDDVDFLYTKAVWKDATTITGFGWHWDHTYWGGAPKFSTWLALDDANESNGCLKLVAGSHKLVPQLLERFAPSFQRTRENDEDPWLQKSGAPPTRGDDFIIDEPRLDAFLAEHRLSRTTEPARAGDVLFFSSLALHASFHNTTGCADRWALISTYRDAATPDTSKVFPKPRPVLRRGCATLGLKAHVEHPTSEEELAARYIKPGVHLGLG